MQINKIISVFAFIVIKIVGSCLLTQEVDGQISRSILFEDRPYNSTIKADTRAPYNKILFLAYSKEFEYQRSKGNLFLWEMQLGQEFPLYIYENDDTETSISINSWGIGLWFPVSFHMVEDLKSESNPIINTDYRFMAMFKGALGVDFFDSFKQEVIGFKLIPFGHESTHLGDEFSIYAKQKYPNFMRVNLSWEFYEANVGYSYFKNDAEVTMRLGFIGSFTKVGFYTWDSAETNGRILTPSKNRIESIYFQYQRTFHSSVGMSDYRPFISIDIRSKILFNYLKPMSQENDTFAPSINLISGLTSKKGAKHIKLDPYIQIYYGVNPNGQFRNDSKYWIVGFGFTLE
jgi:hypothetical protein